MRGTRPFCQTETQLVAACLQWLRMHHSFVWRQNQGALRVEGSEGKRERFVRFASAKGISDIIGCLPCGCFLAVECKVGKNALTDDQRAFLEGAARANGVAMEVREVRELIRMVEAHEAGCRKREKRGAGAARTTQNS